MALPQWIKDWVSPTGFVIVIGGIIWAIQLNVGFVQLTSTQAKILERQELHILEDQEHARQLNRVVLLLDVLERRLADTEKDVKQHNRDAEGWKQKILLMEQKIDGYTPHN